MPQATTAQHTPVKRVFFTNDDTAVEVPNLLNPSRRKRRAQGVRQLVRADFFRLDHLAAALVDYEIGRASCRERV